MDRRKRNRRASDKDRSFLNRRSGERRKHGEANNYVHDWGYALPSRPMYQKDPYGAFFYDRRSGKDRRKG